MELAEIEYSNGAVTYTFVGLVLGERNDGKVAIVNSEDIPEELLLLLRLKQDELKVLSTDKLIKWIKETYPKIKIKGIYNHRIKILEVYRIPVLPKG